MKTLEFMFIALFLLLVSILISTIIVFIIINIIDIWKETKEEEDEYYQKQLLYQDRLKRISGGKDDE